MISSLQNSKPGRNSGEPLNHSQAETLSRMLDLELQPISASNKQRQQQWRLKDPREASPNSTQQPASSVLQIVDLIYSVGGSLVFGKGSEFKKHALGMSDFNHDSTLDIKSDLDFVVVITDENVSPKAFAMTLKTTLNTHIKEMFNAENTVHLPSTNYESAREVIHIGNIIDICIVSDSENDNFFGADDIKVFIPPRDQQKTFGFLDKAELIPYDDVSANTSKALIQSRYLTRTHLENLNDSMVIKLILHEAQNWQTAIQFKEALYDRLKHRYNDVIECNSGNCRLLKDITFYNLLNKVREEKYTPYASKIILITLLNNALYLPEDIQQEIYDALSRGVSEDIKLSDTIKNTNIEGSFINRYIEDAFLRNPKIIQVINRIHDLFEAPPLEPTAYQVEKYIQKLHLLIQDIYNEWNNINTSYVSACQYFKTFNKQPLPELKEIISLQHLYNRLTPEGSDNPFSYSQPQKFKMSNFTQFIKREIQELKVSIKEHNDILSYYSKDKKFNKNFKAIHSDHENFLLKISEINSIIEGIESKSGQQYESYFKDLVNLLFQACNNRKNMHQRLLPAIESYNDRRKASLKEFKNHLNSLKSLLQEKNEAEKSLELIENKTQTLLETIRRNKSSLKKNSSNKVTEHAEKIKQIKQAILKSRNKASLSHSEKIELEETLNFQTTPYSSVAVLEKNIKKIEKQLLSFEKRVIDLTKENKSFNVKYTEYNDAYKNLIDAFKNEYKETKNATHKIDNELDISRKNFLNLTDEIKKVTALFERKKTNDPFNLHSELEKILPKKQEDNLDNKSASRIDSIQKNNQKTTQEKNLLLIHEKEKLTDKNNQLISDIKKLESDYKNILSTGFNTKLKEIKSNLEDYKSKIDKYGPIATSKKESNPELITQLNDAKKKISDIEKNAQEISRLYEELSEINSKSHIPVLKRLITLSTKTLELENELSQEMEKCALNHKKLKEHTNNRLINSLPIQIKNRKLFWLILASILLNSPILLARVRGRFKNEVALDPNSTAKDQSPSITEMNHRIPTSPKFSQEKKVLSAERRIENLISGKTSLITFPQSITNEEWFDTMIETKMEISEIEEINSCLFKRNGRNVRALYLTDTILTKIAEYFPGDVELTNYIQSRVDTPPPEELDPKFMTLIRKIEKEQAQKNIR